MKKTLTLMLVVDRKTERVLLGLKKRGFGCGKYNGFGGKVERGETILQAAQRELQEECGITAIDPVQYGKILFEFKGEAEKMEVHVFSAENYTGNIAESEEMRPEWFSLKNIPYEKMWADDVYWMPLILQKKSFEGYFLFKGTEVILNKKLTVIKR